MRALNPLYIMAKPLPETANRIAALQRNDARRGPELLHATMLTLFDLATAPLDWLPSVIVALAAFESDAFPLVFDRIEARRAVTLRSSAPLVEARAFQAALIRFLLARGAPCLGTTPVPHLTINYRGDRLGAQSIAAVGWMVSEVLLIESVVGQARHIVHARVPLRPRRPEITFGQRTICPASVL